MPKKLHLKPWYVWRPQQLLLKAFREIIRPADPYTLKLPTGQRIEINPQEGIGRSLLRRGAHDIAVSEMVLRLLRGGDVSIDAGANIGFITQLMALGVAPGGNVFSYEPHPRIYQRLLRNVGYVKEVAPQVKIEADLYALSSSAGFASLELPQGFDTNEGLARLSRNPASGSTIQVECRRLDELIPVGDICLLKIDVEGHEYDVLRGAERLLRARTIRHIIFEDHQGEDSSVIRLLHEHGYTIRRLGWQLGGPVLADLSDYSVVRPPEPPNFIATLDLQTCRTVMEAKGWKSLRAWSVPAVVNRAGQQLFQ